MLPSFQLFVYGFKLIRLVEADQRNVLVRQRDVHCVLTGNRLRTAAVATEQRVMRPQRRRQRNAQTASGLVGVIGIQEKRQVFVDVGLVERDAVVDDALVDGVEVEQVQGVAMTTPSPW